MKHNQETGSEINAMLNSLDGLEKASPGPFFYTRVSARLQREETSWWSNLAGFVARPSVALATLFLIFLLNAVALMYQRSGASSSPLSEQFEQNSNDDYNTTLAANSYYDENTDLR
jgi:hypothetical protein